MTDTYQYKYVIFLSKKYIQKSIFFKSIYECVRKRIENKGIKIKDYETTITTLNATSKYNDFINQAPLLRQNSLLNLSLTLQNNNTNSIDSDKCKTVDGEFYYDDSLYPCENILYIHLFNGYYYNDKCYSKKKLAMEREILFLVAGNLGVKSITYENTITEHIVTRNSANIKLKGIRNKIAYEKTIGSNSTINGSEEYENNGAPIYCSSDNLTTLENKLRVSLESLQSHVYNYEFYKNNAKLETFVYKRFYYKISKMVYTAETDDISDMSFTVASCFADYGLQVAFEKNITTTEKIKYTMIFYSDSELQTQYLQSNYQNGIKDPFFMIKQFYEIDKSKNKDISINHIKNYIFDLASKYRYKPRGGLQFRENLVARLQHYINDINDHVFKKKCREFSSTLDIKSWMYNNLINNDTEEINNPDFLSSDITCLHSSSNDENDYNSIMDNDKEKIQCDNNNDNPNSVKSMEMELALIPKLETPNNNELISVTLSTPQPCLELILVNNQQKTLDTAIRNPEELHTKTEQTLDNEQLQTNDDINCNINGNTLISIPTVSNNSIQEPIQEPIYALSSNLDNSKVSEINNISELVNIKPKPCKRSQSNKINISTPVNIKELESMLEEHKKLQSEIETKLYFIESYKCTYENDKKQINKEINECLIELGICKGKLKTYQEKQVHEQILQLGLSSNSNNTNIISEAKLALKKLLSSENNSINKMIETEQIKVNDYQYKINSKKNELEKTYTYMKKLILEYDALIEARNNLEQIIKYNSPNYKLPQTHMID